MQRLFRKAPLGLTGRRLALFYFCRRHKFFPGRRITYTELSQQSVFHNTLAHGQFRILCGKFTFRSVAQ